MSNESVVKQCLIVGKAIKRLERLPKLKLQSKSTFLVLVNVGSRKNILPASRGSSSHAIIGPKDELLSIYALLFWYNWCQNEDLQDYVYHVVEVHVSIIDFKVFTVNRLQAPSGNPVCDPPDLEPEHVFLRAQVQCA